MYAHVSFPISSFKTFTYNIPKKLVKDIHPGICVNAPINQRIQTGFVINNWEELTSKMLELYNNPNLNKKAIIKNLIPLPKIEPKINIVNGTPVAPAEIAISL